MKILLVAERLCRTIAGRASHNLFPLGSGLSGHKPGIDLACLWFRGFRAITKRRPSKATFAQRFCRCGFRERLWSKQVNVCRC